MISVLVRLLSDLLNVVLYQSCRFSFVFFNETVLYFLVIEIDNNNIRKKKKKDNNNMREDGKQ